MLQSISVEIFDKIRSRFSELYGDRGERQLERLMTMVGRYGVGTERRDHNGLWTESDTILITYGDSIRNPGEPALQTLRRFAGDFLRPSIGTIHILPFFPYSSDDGFSVIDYRKVRDDVGAWKDVKDLGDDFNLMFDLVLNHVSRKSGWFSDFERGISPASRYFIEVDPATDLSRVVRPRNLPLLTPAQTPAGKRHLWTTFSDDQFDLNFANSDVLFEFLDILFYYISMGVRIVRLDAIAYLWKEIGTPCIHHPMTHTVVSLFREVLELVAPDVLVLTETNVPHEENISYFGRGDEAHMVYQFSLPPLLLHALNTGTARYLTAWAAGLSDIPPQCTYLNFTASHDGIGVRPLEGIVPEKEIETLLHEMRRRGGRISTKRNADGTQSPYELNITYFDALGDPDSDDTDLHTRRFLCSQAVALGLQGIPAVYVHSLFGARNDIEGVERTGQARSINRMRWSDGDLRARLGNPNADERKVFDAYTRMLEIRRKQPAFHPDAGQRVFDIDDRVFAVERFRPEADAGVLCLFNLSSNAVQIQIPADMSMPSGGQLRDLLSGDSCNGDSASLDPYQVMWLTRQR